MPAAPMRVLSPHGTPLHFFQMVQQLLRVVNEFLPDRCFNHKESPPASKLVRAQLSGWSMLDMDGHIDNAPDCFERAL